MGRDATADVLYIVIFMAVFAAVLFFAHQALHALIHYNRKQYQLKQDRIVLEIRTPRIINKTPEAMELIFNGIFEPAGGDWYTNLTSGAARPYFSFEIASIGGAVHFYIHSERDQKARIEAHFYAQYPDVELVEVPDYTKNFPFSWDTHKLSGYEFKLTEPDPVPIKTYKIADYDLKGDDPTLKVDPISQTIEVMANIKPNEQMWVQFVTRAHKGQVHVKLSWVERIKKVFGILTFDTISKKVGGLISAWEGYEHKDWRKEGEKMVKEHLEKYKDAGPDQVPKGEKMRIEAIQENVSKVAYDCGIRCIYIGPLEGGTPGIGQGMGSIFKQHSSSGSIYNDLRPGLIPKYFKPWEDRSGVATKQMARDLLRHYRAREYFTEDVIHYPHGKRALVTFTLSTEELATLYHLPGDVVQTPTFERVESTTGTAPSNLPI